MIGMCLYLTAAMMIPDDGKEWEVRGEVRGGVIGCKGV